MLLVVEDVDEIEVAGGCGWRKSAEGWRWRAVSILDTGGCLAMSGDAGFMRVKVSADNSSR
jgi:hypothetical protein